MSRCILKHFHISHADVHTKSQMYGHNAGQPVSSLLPYLVIRFDVETRLTYNDTDSLISLPTNSELQKTWRQGRAAVASSTSFRGDNEVGVASGSESHGEDFFRQQDMFLNALNISSTASKIYQHKNSSNPGP